MTRTSLILTSVAAAAFAVVAKPAPAATVPAGLWSTQGGRAQVRIEACGATLCATLVGLKKPTDERGRPRADVRNPDPAKRARPVIGLSLLSGMTPDGEAWAGRFYNPDDGETYAGTLAPGADGTLRLKGCVLGGLLCRTQVLTRVS